MTDEELIARLRGVTIKQHAYGAYTRVPDPLSASAADRIEALVGETGKIWEAEQRGYANAMEAERKLHEDRIESLVNAFGILEDALQEVGDDYPGSNMQEWCQQQVKAARAALKGDKT